MKEFRLAILISGRGSNMEAIVINTLNGNLSGLARASVVISNKEGAAGLERAKELGVATEIVVSKGKLREDFEKELIDCVNKYEVDYIILAGFNRVLSPDFISNRRDKIINIHPADTKAFQGLHGYEWAYNHKLLSTSITVHLVDEGIDTGEILAQTKIDISEYKSLEEIEKRGIEIENIFYSEVLKEFFGRVNNSAV